MDGTDFEEFRQALGEDFFTVDSREWDSDWSSRWVAFADLLGFAGICERSDATATNVLVRFHRCVSGALDAEPAVEAFRFTDATYFVSEDLAPLLRACSRLQHLVLATNRTLLERKRVQAEHLLMVRTTCAQGTVLMRKSGGRLHAGAVGVDLSALLAGSGIVAAYRLERSATAHEVAVGGDLGEDQFNVRGVVGNGRALLQSWADQQSPFDHDGVRTFPWPLMRANQPEGDGLWADEKRSVHLKLKILQQILNMNFGGYVSTTQPIAAVKHFGAAQRQLALYVQLLAGHKRIKRWTANEIEARINALPVREES